jgi:pimeloyl-ACP methyl ester carboxylesterase
MKSGVRVFATMVLAVGGSHMVQGLERWQTIPTPPPLPAATRTGFAPVNGIKMFYAEYGRGDPILLIPIGAADAEMWSAVIPILSHRHTVVVADSRGHGRSTRTDQPFTYDLMSSDYLALLDYLGIERVALVGASDGAIIGLDIAMHHPERLTKLFAQGANVTLDGIFAKAAEPAASKAAAALWGADYRRMSETPDQYDALHSALGKMWDSEPSFTAAQLAGIHTPTAVVMSDHDEWIKPAHARYIAHTIPGARIVMLRNVSHYAALQDPAGYANAVLRFVDGG